MKKVFLLLTVLSFLFNPIAWGQKKAKTKKTNKKMDYLITISTEFGDMTAILYDEAPQHKANFVKLTEEKFYDSLLFHRIIENFMIQGGDPQSKNAASGARLGMGDNGYRVPAEFNEKLFHKKGALAAARDNNPQKASSGCQFYIVQGKAVSENELNMIEKQKGRKIPTEQREVYKTTGGVPHLDQDYTVFGEVIRGLEVIDKIASQPADQSDRPSKDIKMHITVQKMSKKDITEKYGYSYPVEEVKK